MTDGNNIEKKMNYMLEKQSSQKGDGGAVKTETTNQGLQNQTRKKVFVKVKRNSSTPKEKKEVEGQSSNNAQVEESAKVKVTARPRKKEDSSKENEEKKEVALSSFVEPTEEKKDSEQTIETIENTTSFSPQEIKKDVIEEKVEKDLPSESFLSNNSSTDSNVVDMNNTINDASITGMEETLGNNDDAMQKDISKTPSITKEEPEKKDFIRKEEEKKHSGYSGKGSISSHSAYTKEKRMEDRKRIDNQSAYSNKSRPSSFHKDDGKEEISSCIIRDKNSPSSATPVKRYGSIDELNKRPNIKAGNLSDGAKKYRYNRKNQDGKPSDARQRQGQFGDRRKEWGSNQKSFEGRKFGNQDNRGRTGTGSFDKKPFSLKVASPLVAPIPLEVQKQNKKARGAKKDYSRKTKEEEFFEEKQTQQRKKVREKVSAVPSEIQILDTISVADLAKKMNLRASEIIGKLMENGMMVTVNQSIDSDTAQIIASDYDCNVKVVSLYDETIIESASDEGIELKARPPIVTVMGHVDHGKTKTLDAIRSSNVAAGEFGGITQHIGAYTVSYNNKPITFLDTPGHEAFTMMRARGASITDIVVLVVAADDGVMPQTIEAINHAKDAKVPIIVAINKIDKPEANPEKIKNRLSELDLMPEDWGGKTMYVEISALKKQGISDLLEAILLQAEVLELKANYDCKAEGKVLESKIDHGRGVVASIIVQKGILREGDPYVAGIYSGHVRAIFNDKGERVTEAFPSMPCEILGLDEMPNAGDPFQVTESEKVARQISDKRRELKRFEVAKAVKKVTLDNLYDTIQEGELLELKVIIKADVQGSVEALTQSLEKLSNSEIRLNVIHASAGAINESDVMLATADSNVIIIGFNVRPTVKARLLAETEKVDIRKYTIIYQAVEEIKLAMEGMLSPDKKEVVVGNAEIRNVFKVSKVGNIAGVYVLDGNIKRNYLVNVIRDGVVVSSSLKIASLKRFKDDVKEVNQGFECGLNLENFNDILVGDTLEFIEIQEVSRKLK